jgi:UDPglucose 6-dehydrogenase
MKKLLIIGYGIVGKAVYEGLGRKNLIDILDPGENFNCEKSYNSFEGIILCLPTPAGPAGECDDFLVEQYIRIIRKQIPNIPILIKSTISIDLVEILKNDIYLTYNPEFLTEADSLEEFKKQKFAIFGGHQCRFWYEIFINSDIKIKKVRFTSMKNAAFTKYSINSFLATKVIFFNELKKLYNDTNFDTLTELISLDKRIGKSHMMVPGSDGINGFGGMCLPKDTSAFTISAKRKKVPLKLLEKVIKINNEIRRNNI